MDGRDRSRALVRLDREGDLIEGRLYLLIDHVVLGLVFFQHVNHRIQCDNPKSKWEE
jgi:hypothetical protein